VKNGHAPSLKKRWKCKICSKTFDKNTGKSFPATTFPFPFIAFVLYIYQNTTLKKTKEGVNNWLNHFKKNNIKICPKETVSISTIYKWRKNYGKIYTNLVSKKEIMIFSSKLANKIKNLNIKITNHKCTSPEFTRYEIIETKRECSHMEVLDKFKEMAESIGKDPLIYMKKYSEIVDLILKQYKIEVIRNLNQIIN
jgi:hypothetical protein